MRRHKIQKRLGYNLDTKLLIVHADDAGLCSAANRAIIDCLERGAVNSASIMASCPAFAEAAAYFRDNPGVDVGVHITLTSEWPNHKWGPVLESESVPSLVDRSGCFHGHGFHQHAHPDDAEREVRAQIERVLESGLEPSHLDCHMNCLFFSDPLFRVLVRVSEDYEIPAMINRQYADHFQIDLDEYLGRDAVLVNRIYMARPDNVPSGVEAYYRECFSSLQPGLNVMLVHPAFDDEEMRAITGDILPWGARWRQADHDFYVSEECGRLLEGNGITMISWGEIKKALLTGGKSLPKNRVEYAD